MSVNSWDRKFDQLFDRKRPNDCWIYNGNINPGGYGCFYPEGTVKIFAHRYAYSREYGAVPEGLVVDHKCRVRSCVNPAHLRAVTNSENTLCGIGPTAINARKTHCNRGHSLSGKNLYVRFDGFRKCRACHIIGAEKYRANKRAKRLAILGETQP